MHPQRIVHPFELGSEGTIYLINFIKKKGLELLCFLAIAKERVWNNTFSFGATLSDQNSPFHDPPPQWTSSAAEKIGLAEIKL